MSYQTQTIESTFIRQQTPPIASLPTLPDCAAPASVSVQALHRLSLCGRSPLAVAEGSYQRARRYQAHCRTLRAAQVMSRTFRLAVAAEPHEDAEGPCQALPPITLGVEAVDDALLDLDGVMHLLPVDDDRQPPPTIPGELLDLEDDAIDHLLRRRIQAAASGAAERALDMRRVVEVDADRLTRERAVLRSVGYLDAYEELRAGDGGVAVDAAFGRDLAALVQIGRWRELMDAADQAEGDALILCDAADEHVWWEAALRLVVVGDAGSSARSRWAVEVRRAWRAPDGAVVEAVRTLPHRADVLATLEQWGADVAELQAALIEREASDETWDDVWDRR